MRRLISLHDAAMPTATSLNTTDDGMAPNSGRDETQRFQAAINDAQTKQLPLFVPAGAYHIGTVAIAGAFALYSTAARAIFRGNAAQGPCLAIGSGRASGPVRISDIAMDGAEAPAPPNR